VYVARGIAQHEELNAVVASAGGKLGRDVVRLRHSVRENWSGDPAVYFLVLLTDSASKPPRLHKVAKQVEAIIEEQVQRSPDCSPFDSMKAIREPIVHDYLLSLFVRDRR